MGHWRAVKDPRLRISVAKNWWCSSLNSQSYSLNKAGRKISFPTLFTNIRVTCRFVCNPHRAVILYIKKIHYFSTTESNIYSFYVNKYMTTLDKIFLIYINGNSKYWHLFEQNLLFLENCNVSVKEFIVMVLCQRPGFHTPRLSLILPSTYRSTKWTYTRRVTMEIHSNSNWSPPTPTNQTSPMSARESPRTRGTNGSLRSATCCKPKKTSSRPFSTL